MKFIDRLIGRALARRYRIDFEHGLVYMDASEPITEFDMALMKMPHQAAAPKRVD